jgi:hypothetical protein
MRLVSRFGYGSLLGLSTFVATSAGYTGCTGEVRQPTPPAPLACPSGEVTHTVGGDQLCCNGNDCRSLGPTTARLGAPCSAGEADQAVDDVTGTLDVCVNESCNGDRVASDYLDTVTETKGTLACVAGGGGATWQWKGSVKVHRLVQACADVQIVVCYYNGYGYGAYGDGCGCHTGPAGSPVCWDGYPCPSSYGYNGANTIMQREVTLVSSTCSVDGAPPTPCPVGTL